MADFFDKWVLQARWLMIVIALAAVFGVEPSLVKCRLLSTNLGEVVEVDEVKTQGYLDL